MFLVGFTALFVLTGLGNGSTYQMIPGVFRAKALARGLRGEEAAAHGRRLSGAAMGLIGAVGALGGLGIKASTSRSGSPSGPRARERRPSGPSLVLYGVCSVLTWAVYLRRTAAAPAKPRLRHAEV